MAIKALIGLGNPGPQFLYTRHNIGFRIADALVEQYSGTWRSRDQMEYAEIRIGDTPLLVIKPQTFMNLSGKVCPFLQKKGITADQLLVAHDEMEKPFGSITLKQGGSHKGHNGLKSIMAFYGPDFWRLRFGIGRPENKEDVSQYVLGKFTEKPEEVERLIQQTVGMILEL